ncbi:hypothetical protein [Plantactinospora sp. CA-290183]|uniref:hypothetical protein n=1 Tax=Plantactinospora sp. CA-290183 TaxID=3240006 RepID=UPI003D8F4074
MPYTPPGTGPLADLLNIMERERQHATALESRREMWLSAYEELNDAAIALRKENEALAASWGADGESNGVAFQDVTTTELRHLTDTVLYRMGGGERSTAGGTDGGMPRTPWGALARLIDEIHVTHAFVKDLHDRAAAAQAQIDSMQVSGFTSAFLDSEGRQDPRDALQSEIRGYRTAALEKMNALDEVFRTAAGVLTAAAPPDIVRQSMESQISLPPAGNPGGASPGGSDAYAQPPGGGPGGVPGATNGTTAVDSAMAASGEMATDDVVAGASPPAGSEANPSLSGTATAAPPTMPPGAAPGPGGGAPGGMTAPPPTVPPGGGPGGFGPTIPPPIPPGGPGGSRVPGPNVGGGARVPGVNLGALGGGAGAGSFGGFGGSGGFGGGVAGVGSSSLPQAAAPVGVPAQVAPSGPPPALPTAAATGASATAGGAPMMPPPMMPPMAGAQPGGGGGAGPGSGAARSGATGRSRGPQNPTPGMPALLSGKAGKGNPQAAPVRPRRIRESDAPSTVELIDEDLWQVDKRAEEPRPASRIRRH